MEVMCKVTDWTSLTIHLSNSFGQMVQSHTHTHNAQRPPHMDRQEQTEKRTHGSIYNIFVCVYVAGLETCVCVCVC